VIGALRSSSGKCEVGWGRLAIWQAYWVLDVKTSPCSVPQKSNALPALVPSANLFIRRLAAPLHVALDPRPGIPSLYPPPRSQLPYLMLYGHHRYDNRYDNLYDPT